MCLEREREHSVLRRASELICLERERESSTLRRSKWRHLYAHWLVVYIQHQVCSSVRENIRFAPKLNFSFRSSCLPISSLVDRRTILGDPFLWFPILGLSVPHSLSKALSPQFPILGLSVPISLRTYCEMELFVDLDYWLNVPQCCCSGANCSTIVALLWKENSCSLRATNTTLQSKKSKKILRVFVQKIFRLKNKIYFKKSIKIRILIDRSDVVNVRRVHHNRFDFQIGRGEAPNSAPWAQEHVIQFCLKKIHQVLRKF